MGRIAAGRSLNRERIQKETTVKEVVKSLDALMIEQVVVPQVIETRIVEKIALDESKLNELKYHFDHNVNQLQSQIDHKNEDIKDLFYGLQDSVTKLNLEKADKDAANKAVNEMRIFQELAQEQLTSALKRVKTLEERPESVKIDTVYKTPNWVKYAFIGQMVLSIALYMLK